MLLAQHGWGKGTLVIDALKEGHIDGLVLSPRDEAPERLRAHVEELRKKFGDAPEILFDPQLYALTIPNHRLGKLTEYYEDLDPGLTRADLSSPRRYRASVQKILRLQHSLGVSRLISPTVLVSSFQDPWSQIALALAEESIEAAGAIPGAPPLYVSLVVDENALLAHDAIEEFLDIVTGWEEVAGFYLVVRPHDGGYPAILQEGAVAGLLYLTYVLATVNRFEVVVGYCDLIGTLLHAVGARHTASGWFNSLRKFSLRRFEPSTGGRQPRPRYTSGPLMTPILVVPELETTERLGYLDRVLSGTKYDQVFTRGSVGSAAWPQPARRLHHWAVLRDLAERIHAAGSGSARLAAAEQMITVAQLTFAELSRGGVGFEAATGGRHLAPWLRGVQALRRQLGV